MRKELKVAIDLIVTLTLLMFTIFIMCFIFSYTSQLIFSIQHVESVIELAKFESNKALQVATVMSPFAFILTLIIVYKKNCKSKLLIKNENCNYISGNNNCARD